MCNLSTPTLFDPSIENNAGAFDESILHRGTQLNQACDEWIIENAPAYRWLTKQVLSAARHGVKVSIREKCERIRWADMTGIHGKPTKLSNSLTAPLARRIIAEHPHVAPYITLKPSICDVRDSSGT